MSATVPIQIETLCKSIREVRSETVNKPTLVYFDIIGIAWPIRCMLHLKQVDYDLIQINLKQWGYHTQTGERPVKQCFRNGHMPLYVDEDVSLNQSNLIMTHLAEKLGLISQDKTEKYAAMEVMTHAYDALFHFNGMLPIIIKIAIADDVVNARREAFMGNGIWGVASDGFRSHLDGFSNYLDSNPADSGYFVGDELSIADLHAFNVLCNWYKAFAPETFSNEYPKLDAFIQRIASNPAVGDYILTRQEPTTWFARPDLAIQLTSAEELQGLI